MINVFCKISFLKKYAGFILLFLISGIFLSAWFLPSVMWTFVATAILFLLATSIFFILKKHKGADDKRQKVTRDIVILVVTLTVIVLLGWLTGTLVGRQAQAQFGARIGLLCALIVSFVVGYLVKKGLGKVLR
jgi:cytochrome bd-type quinol oxidase subunit 2